MSFVLTRRALRASCAVLTSATFATFFSLPLLSNAATLQWPGHTQTADTWIGQVSPANNSYGSPTSIYYDQNQVLHATAVCGSFTTQLILQSYQGIVSSSTLKTMTGSTSPNAAQWHDGILKANNLVNGVLLHTLDSDLNNNDGRTLRHGNNTLLAAGDILAAKYDGNGFSGHVMTVHSFVAPDPQESLELTGTHVIPGVTFVKRWLVTVVDSSSSVHGVTDSRYGRDPQEDDGHDHGIGKGSIYLYEDATPNSPTLGKLVGWTWSTASSYTFQFSNQAGVDNKGKTTYRPMVIGRMTGGGL